MVSAKQSAAVSSDGTTLHASGATGTYQWLFNQHPIEGAVASSYVPGSTGSYSVAVNSKSGCTVISNPFWYSTAPGKVSFDIFPNPSTGRVSIKVSAADSKEATVQCLSLSGLL